MKIGLITQWYPPEHGSAALPGTIAAALHAAGHDVEVVTAYPNYPDGVLQEGWRQRWDWSEHKDGITVHRTPVYVSHDHRAWRRMVNYLSFAVSATYASMRRLRSVDVIWVHGTPALPALPAMVMRRVFGIPYVLHIQDLWPDTVFASGMLPKRLEPFVRRPLELFCQLSYSAASVIGVITPGMRAALLERGVENDKITDIPNWADETIFYPSPADDKRAELGLPDGFVAMYAGAIGEVQGLDTLVHAAAHLTEDPRIHIAIVGDGVAKPKLVELVQALGLENVTFVDPQPLAGMSTVLKSGDVQVVCLKDLPLYRITLPSKVQATLAAGRPLVVSAGGDAGTLVETAGAGLACAPGDPDALAQSIRHAADAGPDQLQRWADSGRSYYANHLSEQTGVERMGRALTRASQAVS